MSSDDRRTAPVTAPGNQYGIDSPIGSVVDPLIDPAAPPAGVVLLGHVAEPATPDYHTWLFRRDRRLILRTRSDSSGSEGQRSLPIEAAGWIHRTIADGFWKDPEDGGLPRRTYQVRENVGGEDLELRRGWGIGGPGEAGFTLTNFSRVTRHGYPEEYGMTDALLLEGGLLELFRKIGADGQAEGLGEPP